MEAAKPGQPAETTFSHVKAGDSGFKSDGLRDFFLYRDLGIAKATGRQSRCDAGRGQQATGGRHRLAPAYRRFPHRDHAQGLGPLHVRRPADPGRGRRLRSSTSWHSSLFVRLFEGHGIFGSRGASQLWHGRDAGSMRSARGDALDLTSRTSPTRTKFEPARNNSLSALVTGPWLGYRAATPVMMDERRGIAARAAKLARTYKDCR